MSITAEQATQVLEQAQCCFTLPKIEQAIDSMAENISARLQYSNPLVLCVMNGGLMTTARLVQRLGFPLQYDYIHATRYEGRERGGDLNWIARPSYSLARRNILLVDDILDEGVTLSELVDFCMAEGANSVQTAVLVNKIHSRKQMSQADYMGLSIDDRYIFGFGMDYKGYWRNLPAIYAVK